MSALLEKVRADREAQEAALQEALKSPEFVQPPAEAEIETFNSLPDPIEAPQMELAYFNLRGKRLIRKDGSVFQPREASKLFPKTEEEIELCEYFAKLGHLVRL